MKDVMFADYAVEERKEILDANCDQIVERYYTRKFSSEEIEARRVEVCDKATERKRLEEQLKEITKDFKDQIKPLTERLDTLLDEIRSGGEEVKGDCYKFVFPEEGKTGFYNAEGYLVESREMTAEERQRTVFQTIGARRTGTED